MIKKIAALLLIILAAYIMLPFGFGLWNESIGVRGQITFAESPSPSSELMPDDSNSAPSGKKDAASETAPDSAQGEGEQEIAEPQTAAIDCPESSTSVEPDDSDDDETASPEAAQPVDAAADAENTAQVEPEAENASEA